MAVYHPPETAYGKEIWKWDHSVTEQNPHSGEFGMRPDSFQEFPKRLYKAGRNHAGVPVIVDAHDVENEQQEANMRSRGYYFGQDKALEALHAADQEMSVLAANRAFTDRRMTPQAQAEAQAVDESTSTHLAEIPAAPIKRRQAREDSHA